MTAKTAAERNKAMRDRNKAAGLVSVRINAPAELHAAIRKYAALLIDAEKIREMRE